MYKWFVAGIALVVTGDPGFSWLENVEQMKDAIIATMFALVAVPWVVSQFDN